MPPLDSTNPNSLDRIMPVDHGSSIAREVQSQVAASLGRDSALGMAGTEALGLPGAGAEQTVSPLINMITKMPGHIGFFSSLFDALGAFFAPQLEALSNLGMNLGLDPSMMGHMSLGMPEHVGLDLSLLPADAPIFGMNGLKDAAHGLNGDLLSSKLNASLGQGLNLHRDAAGLQGSLQESLQISAPGNLLNKPVFEGGHLSGPSLAQTQPAPQLAGNNRLFSDSIGSSGHNLSGQSMSAAANSSGNNINVNGSTFGNSSDPVDLTVGGRDEQLLAMGGDSYQSTVGSMKPDSSAAAASAENLGGMKAKALSLDSQAAPADMKAHGLQDMKGDIKGDLKHDLKHDVKAEAKHDIKEAKAEPRTHKTFDRSSHSLKPSHHNAQAKAPAVRPIGKPVNQPVVDQPKIDQPKIDQAQEIRTETAQNPQAQQEIASQVPGQEQLQPQQATDAGNLGSDKLNIGQEPRTYTIRSGDCLWNIAKDQLGSAAKWSDIYKLNSDLLGANPDLIRPGTTIQLPGTADAGASTISQYTVKPGDNLWNIAKDQLGDGSKWGDLYKNNQDIIGANPRLIQPGQTLNIGGDPAQMAAAPAQNNLAMANPNPVAVQAQAPTLQPVQSYGAENLTSQQSSFSNYEAMPVTHQISPPANLGAEKVMPAQSQPDAIIQPAHAAAADEIIVPNTSLTELSRSNNNGSVVSTNLANDMMSFLKKKR